MWGVIKFPTLLTSNIQEKNIRKGREGREGRGRKGKDKNIARKFHHANILGIESFTGQNVGVFPPSEYSLRRGRGKGRGEGFTGQNVAIRKFC